MPTELAVQDLIDAAGAAVYFGFGVIHLDLWLRRRHPASHLWLAGAAGGALIVNVTGFLVRHGSATPATVTLNLLGVLVATVAIRELVASLGAKSTPHWVRGIQGILAVAAVSNFVAPGLPATNLVGLGCLGLLIGAMLRAVGTVRTGRPEIKRLALGLVVLLATLVFDLAMHVTHLPYVYGPPILGFTVLFLSAASVINDRSYRERLELEALKRELEARVAQRTEQLQAANRRLEEVSRTDDLTSLPNRRGFLADAAAEVVRHRRSGKPFSIVLADLDRFKAVNDSLGHAAGDEVLRHAAAVFRGAVREQDLIARWGGEELILLLPETGAPGASHLAESIREALAGNPAQVSGRSLPVTSSFGVATNWHDEPLEATIGRADRALYQAKQGGRDRVVAEPAA